MAYRLSERAFGGFNPASADALATNSTFKQPKPSFVEDPAAAVASEFAEDLGDNSSEMDVEFSESSTIPSYTRSLDLTEEEIPDEQVDIQGAFGNARSLIEGAAPPIPRPLPNALSAGQVFAATFAASFGSQLARNPRMLEDIQRRMAEYEQRRQAIEDQNAVNDLLYNKEKRNALINLELKATELELEQAISANDFKRMTAATKNIERLKGAVELEKEEIRQSGETARTKAILGKKEGKEDKTKRLSANEYLTRLEQIDTADPDKLPEKPDSGFLGLFPKGKDTNKQLSKLGIHATAALTGETPEMQVQGLRRLVAGTKNALGIKEKASRDQGLKFGKALTELGIPEDVVAQELLKIGIRLGKRPE